MTAEKRPTAIVADDEPHIRMMLRTLLRSAGFDVVAEAGNGQEAVELHASAKPDLMLLDINMPRKTGQEALAEIIAASPEALVVMLTSLADMETVEDCIGKGAANYIRKDTPLQEMKKLIKETWEQRGGGDSDA